jgi:septal ring factor EnvC (AmiA/AmiB activator)
MAPRQAEMQKKIDDLTHELELGTYLNKGILQTNNEHKLRIAELERENAMLSMAEQKLASTEDALEEAERRLKELEEEQEDWEKRLSGLENERDDWKARCEVMAKAWKSASETFDQAMAPPAPQTRGETSRSVRCCECYR